jgi:restriction system protein
MTSQRTMWGIHLEWDKVADQKPPADIAIGWAALGDLSALPPSRDAFKARYVHAYPDEKPGAVPVKAGILYRFAREMQLDDIIVYPSKSDRMIHVGKVLGPYEFMPTTSERYPHRRRVAWLTSVPRAQISQPALYEIGSAITLFQISNNAEEFLAAATDKPFKVSEVDDGSAADLGVQAAETVEDFVIKRLKNGITPEQFEHFIAELLRSMGYFVRVTSYVGDGGVDIIAHKDELGFEPPIIKVQCKQILTTIGGSTVRQLLGAIQANEHALFVTLGDYSSDAIRIDRGQSNLRLINGTELVQLILNNYEKFEPRFKSLLPLKRSYAPSVIVSDST